VDGGAELTASPEVVLDALAAAFFFPRFLGGMENENGPRRLFPETEVAELNRGSPFSLPSSYSHTTLTLPLSPPVLLLRAGLPQSLLHSH
jgi:hypothetical protein